MLPELTPDQRAKVARGWVWRDGQLPLRCKARVYAVADDGSICVGDRKSEAWFRPGELAPDLDDDVTADGMVRTARAMWRDESLHVVRRQFDGWMLRRARFGCWEAWNGREWSLLMHQDHDVYPDESEAWLAAILAAPESA